jgi:SLT domain-containing protein
MNSHLGVIGQTAHQVGTVFEDWAINIERFIQNDQNFGKVLQNGVGYLQQFGQFIGNIAIAIGHLLNADPGTVHFLLDFFVGVTKVLDVVTSLPAPILMAALALHSFWLWGGLAASIAASILTPLGRLASTMLGVSAAASNFGRLGSDATGFQRLSAVVKDIGAGLSTAATGIGLWGLSIKTAMTEAEGAGSTALAGLTAATAPLKAAFSGIVGMLASLAANPWTWAIIGAAAIIAVVYEFNQASGAAKNFINTMNQGLSQLNASQAITGILVDMGNLNGQMSITGDTMMKTLQNGTSGFSSLGAAIGKVAMNPGALTQAGFWKQLGGTVMNVGKDINNIWTGNFQNGLKTQENDIHAYQIQLAQLTGQEKNLFQTAGTVMRQNGLSFQESVALMDLAGVKASDTFTQMITKVNNLIIGYRNLGVSGNYLAGAVNAITFQTEQADSKVTAITQATSQWITTITGGESALVSFEQGMQGLATAASGADASLSLTNGRTSLTTRGLATAATAAKAAGVSMDGLSVNSLALRAAFEQQITAGNTTINNLLLLSSAAGMGAKGTTLLTQAARDVIGQLVPFAGNSKQAQAQLVALAQTVDPNITNFKQLTSWLGNTKNAASDLNTKTATLTIAAANLKQDVQNLAGAIQNNLNTAMAQAIVQANGGAKAFDTAANAFNTAHGNINKLIPSAGTLANTIYNLTGSASQSKDMFVTFYEKLGLTQSQADALWSDVTNKGVPTINSAKKAFQDVGNQSGTTGGQFHNFHFGYVDPLSASIDNMKGKTKDAADEMSGHLSRSMGTAGGSANNLNRNFLVPLKNAFHDVWTWVGNVISVFSHFPSSKTTTVNVQGHGSTSISSTIAGVAGGIINLISHLAEGGVIPGYAPGHDSVPAMLSPGEGILTPQAVRSMGGPSTVHSLNRNAKHFAYGGMVSSPELRGGLPDVAAWGSATESDAANIITKSFQQVLTNSVKHVATNAQNAFAAAAAAASGYGGRGAASSGQVIAWLKQAIADTGVPASWLGGLEIIARFESGGNPNAINRTDSNAAAGHPSQGLMQLIPGTFALFHAPGTSYNIDDPVANAAASIRYILNRYGSISNVPGVRSVNAGGGYVGYDSGGMLYPGITMAYNGTGQPERVTPAGGSDTAIHVHLSGDLDTPGLWKRLQAETFRYNSRNSGGGSGITGSVRPR